MPFPRLSYWCGSRFCSSSNLLAEWGGVKVVVTSRKVTIRSIEPLSVFWQEKTAYSSRFHASCSRISSKGLLILWGHCSEHINFSSLRKRPYLWSTVDRRERGRTLC